MKDDIFMCKVYWDIEWIGDLKMMISWEMIIFRKLDFADQLYCTKCMKLIQDFNFTKIVRGSHFLLNLLIYIKANGDVEYVYSLYINEGTTLYINEGTTLYINEGTTVDAQSLGSFWMTCSEPVQYSI